MGRIHQQEMPLHRSKQEAFMRFDCSGKNVLILLASLLVNPVIPGAAGGDDPWWAGDTAGNSF